MVVRLSDGIFDVLLVSIQEICVIVWLHFQFCGTIALSSVFFLGLFKHFCALFYRGTTMVIGGPSHLPEGAAAAGNLVLSKGIAVNASIEAI